MSLGTPGGSASFPNGQVRQQYGRQWGNYTTFATLPNGSGNILVATNFRLEPGDTAYLAQTATTGLEYLCVSAGTAGGGDAVWVVNSGGLGPWSSVLYVDKVRGNDATGTRGDDNLPFQTIQAALNVMLTDDTVSLGPQGFNTVAALTVPATVGRGACVGYKAPGILNTAAWPGSEIIAAANAWEFGANLGITRFYLCDIMHGGTKIISADGSVAPYAKDTFFVSGLWIRNCTGFVTAKYASQVVVQGPAGNGNYIITGCGVVQFFNVQGPGGNFTVTWDSADPLTTTANNGLQVISNSQVSTVTMTKQASVIVDETSRLGSLVGSGLNAVGASVPSVLCCGHIGTVIDFASAGAELPDTATVMTVDFRGSHLYYDRNPGTAAKFKVNNAGPAVNFQTVKMDSTTALPAFAFTADVKVHMTGRGGIWPTATLSTPAADGDILPPTLVIAPTAVAANPQTITYPCRIPAGSTAVTAFVASDNAAAVPTQVISAAGVNSFAAGLNALPFDVPHLSGILTGAPGAVVAYAGDEPTTVALVPVNYPIGRACRTGVLKVYVSTNNLASATTFTLYKNNAATAITLSVGAGATGIFSDTTHTVDFAVDDRYDLRLDNTAGTTVTMVFAASFEMFINPLVGNLRVSVSFPG